MEALKSRDPAACIRALHHYFDSAGGGAAAGGAAGVPPGAAAAAAAAAAGEASKGRCQSALLTLSAAHAELGHTAESLRALHEALRLAQQQGDTWALAHSLAALCRVVMMSEGVSEVPAAAADGDAGGEDSSGGGAGPPAGGLDLAAVQEQLQALELLRRCLKIACQQQCPHIAAFARLAIARFDLQHASAPPQPRAPAPQAAPGGADPGGGPEAAPACAGALRAQAALRDACVLQHAAALAAAAPPAAPAAAAAAAAPQLPGAPQRGRVGELYNPSSVFGSDARGSLRASARACAQAAGAAHLLQAAAWRQYGAPGLAVAHALAHLTCCGAGGGGDGSGGGDAATAWAQLVTLALEQQGPTAADAVLSEAAEQYALQLPKQLAAVNAGMMQARAVEEGDAAAAELWLSELASTAEPGPGLDREIKLDAALARAAALAAGGALAAAHDAAAGAFRDAARAGMQAAATSALLQLGELHLAAGDPSGALPFALSASLHCQRLCLARPAPRAALLVARLWHALAPPPGGARQALMLLRGALLPALAGRDREAVGQLQVAMAEVALSDRMDVGVAAGGSESEQRRGAKGAAAARERAAREAAARLEAGARALEVAGAWRGAQAAWSLLAVLRHAREEGGLRDAAAARALTCQRGPLSCAAG
ncbi:hypothetical protein MNEG_11979 [Monoraphidium neglectum]|uniref:Anaphase-promoting complex subunit 5 n=1 Tax=Monoraphidium neglectum TaxID=145388 RepID=A0A0D2J890_9CHLO|nr:hypothetical protein MNEG_11979 [Monoraphidium neglectum]KIY95982.1 hypothetical protein MNEG_11979 [Monoraphidium neglectum]|eukprot:XP_013895002.1 hypothetical protein MNEG_11979 [Monoraphidium neglectum]